MLKLLHFSENKNHNEMWKHKAIKHHNKPLKNFSSAKNSRELAKTSIYASYFKFASHASPSRGFLAVCLVSGSINLFFCAPLQKVEVNNYCAIKHKNLLHVTFPALLLLKRGEYLCLKESENNAGSLFRRWVGFYYSLRYCDCSVN